MFANKLRWTEAYMLAIFTLVEAPQMAGMNIKAALMQNMMIMVSYYTFHFYSIEAKYTHLDTSISVLQQLQPRIDTFVQLMLWKLYKIFFL